MTSDRDEFAAVDNPFPEALEMPPMCGGCHHLIRDLDDTKRVLYHVVTRYQAWRPYGLPNELTDDAVRIGEEHLRLLGHWPSDGSGGLA